MMETVEDFNPFTGLGTITSLDTVLLTNTEMMSTLTPPPVVSAADLKFANANIKSEVKTEQTYITFDDFAQLYQAYGPPQDSDDLI